MPAPRALLSFHVGPVQPFIEAARTTRDLWAASYLVSWLVDAAMRPVREHAGATLVSPFVQGEPLKTLVPCLPNRFLADVPDATAAELVNKVKQAFDAEWQRICDAVYKAIDTKLAALYPEWGRLWSRQLRAPFEVRVLSTPTFDRDLTDELKPVARLMDAARAVRHVPPYSAVAFGDVPQKCTLVGTYEQMGPANLDLSRAFWRDAANNEHPTKMPYPDNTPRRPGIAVPGGATRSGERLCAPSLVKRFAWAHYFAPALKCSVGEGRFADTATSAAREWMARGARDWSGALSDPRWSGQWLHWRTRNQDEDDDPCPPEIWKDIQDHKRKHGPPPAYLGLLSLDADDLGAKWREDPRGVSKAVAVFALGVESVVEQHNGELIYTGGDNTIAVCPAARAVRLASALNQAFAAAMPGDFHLSAGVAVVHHKEDLRFALDQARKGEKVAKNAGRDRLALTVCRRSGEHATVDLGWPVAEMFNDLVSLFVATGVTDRWAYKLRELMPTLEGVPLELFGAELGRVISKTDGADSLAPVVDRLFRAFLADRSAFRPAAAPFVTLCQSASFLARGRDR